MLLKKTLIFSVSALCFLWAGAVPEYLVTGNSLGRLEKMAEKELCLFYQKIYGKNLKKIPASQAAGKSVIYLGQTDFALKNGVDGQKADSEEWILKTVGDDLIISGGVPVGTLYGVYELLERLGVVFASFDETGLPGNKPAFPNFDEKRKPAFPGRLIHDGIPYQLTRTNVHKKRGADYALWALRNRVNGEQILAVPSYYKGKMFNVPHYPYHNLFDYISRDLYAKHPEYFQMDAQGRRRQPREHRYRGGVCMSNPDVRRIFLESLREKIRTDRKKFPRDEWPCVYDISRLDDTPFHCFCEPCKTISAREGSGTEEGLLFDFINHIAREIRKEYPEIIIRTFGEKRAPKKIAPEKNVLIWIDDLFSRHTPFIPTEKTDNKFVREYRRGWFNFSDNMLMWDYWNLGNNYFTPPRVETIFDTIKPDLKYFHKNNIKSMFIEAGIDPNSPQNFILVNYFVAMHLMVDLNADENKLAEKFMDAYYGKAAPVMKKYFKQIRAGVLRQPQPDATSCGAAHWRYLTPEFMVALYQDFHKAAKLAGGRYAARVKWELVSPVWYTLVNWLSYSSAFEKIGITREKLIAECRELSRSYVETFGPYSKWHKDNFERRFRNVSLNLPRPAKFKSVPEKNFRMLSFADFKNVGMFNAKVVDDPESEMGKALKSADPRPEWHGINRMIDFKHRFYSTQFVLGNHRAPGRVQVFLKQVYQDEKYHWYRIPGSIELRPVADFWGHSWAVQASANRLFLLTTGDPRDNTWEQVWFSAKFTGPAYVPGSKKENAIYVDMMVITRGEKDNEFSAVPQYAGLYGRNRTGDLPKGWSVVRYYQPSGTAKMIKKDGKDAILLTGDPKKITAIEGPKFDCGPRDVVKIRVRTTGKKCRVGLYRYGVKTYIRGNFVSAPDSGMQNEFVFDMSDLPRGNENARCSLAFELLPGGKQCEIDQIEVTVAKNLNRTN